MATWYEVKSWSDRIEPVEVVRSTDASVFTPKKNGGEERRGRNTDAWKYFETWDEAYSCLIERCLRRISDAKAELERAQKQMDIIRSIQKPTP